MKSDSVFDLQGNTATIVANKSELNATEAVIEASMKITLKVGSSFVVVDPTGTYSNSDVSPNFPDAAAIWAAMWQKKSGEKITAAIALDPTALSYLLAVTGPAPLAIPRQL